jgi:hypothetical protein
MPEAPTSVPNGTQNQAQSAQPDAAKKPPEKTPEQRLEEIHEATRRQASEGMKRAQEMKKLREEAEKERQALAKEKAEVDETKQLRELKNRNPRKFLEREFGPEWFEAINKIKLEGGGTTADLAISEADRVRADFEAFKAETAKKAEDEKKERQADEAKRHREEFHNAGQRYLEENKTKFPLIHAAEVAKNLTSHIETHFASTSKSDEEGAEIAGEVLTYSQAAEKMESELRRLFGQMQKALEQAASETKAPGSFERAPRRSLSTDLGATQTGGRPPAKNDRERMQRALAKFDEVIATRKQ